MLRAFQSPFVSLSDEHLPFSSLPLGLLFWSFSSLSPFRTVVFQNNFTVISNVTPHSELAQGFSVWQQADVGWKVISLGR